MTSFFQDSTLVAVAVSLTMIISSALPYFSLNLIGNTKELFLLGVGAMFGICFFDLLPEIFEMGGRSSLLIVAGVWLLYSIIHIFHLGHHSHHGHNHKSEKNPQTEEGLGSFVLFFVSMIAHCFSSGVLLVVSQDLSPAIAKTVFFALIAHKAFESFSVTALVLEQKISKILKASIFATYILSVPAGVVATLHFKGLITPGVALVLSSIAAGTLAGCLIYDFLVPSLSHIHSRPRNLKWMAGGVALTLLALRII